MNGTRAPLPWWVLPAIVASGLLGAWLARLQPGAAAVPGVAPAPAPPPAAAAAAPAEGLVLLRVEPGALVVRDPAGAERRLPIVPAVPAAPVVATTPSLPPPPTPGSMAALPETEATAGSGNAAFRAAVEDRMRALQSR